MMITKVKICGITNYDDAKLALDLGADMLGFNFYPKSPRCVTPDQAAAIIIKLPGFVDVAGIFVNAPVDEIRQIVDHCQINWVQLHGDETPEFCQSRLTLSVRTMKAIRVQIADDIKRAEGYFTDAILLDAFHPDAYGGTGVTFDWNIVGHINKRVFLAGGINPDNAEEAVKLGVYGIDVCSGVESEPGKKDPAKMKALFKNIRYVRG